MPSKLEIIRNTLEGNGGFYIEFENTIKPSEEGYSGLIRSPHMVKFCVAPRNGIYSVIEFNSWMDKLIPLNPTIKKSLQSLQTCGQEDKGKCVKPGFLKFDDKIGYRQTRKTMIWRTSDPDFLKGFEGFRDGMRIEEKVLDVDLRRILEVYCCPDEVSAKRFCKNTHRYPYPVKDMKD